MGRNNTHNTFVTIGATNHGIDDRDQNDYYATDPVAIDELLDLETFSHNIWECACGEGHLSNVLTARGYNVLSTDLIDRGFGVGGVDFLKTTEKFDGDIITNPPYSHAEEFVRHAISIVMPGHRVAMFLKVLFLESVRRGKLFEEYPPSVVYVARRRISCVKNGDFDKYHGQEAQAYAWFIWDVPSGGAHIMSQSCDGSTKTFR